MLGPVSYIKGLSLSYTVALIAVTLSTLSQRHTFNNNSPIHSSQLLTHTSDLPGTAAISGLQTIVAMTLLAALLSEYKSYVCAFSAGIMAANRGAGHL